MSDVITLEMIKEAEKKLKEVVSIPKGYFDKLGILEAQTKEPYKLWKEYSKYMPKPKLPPIIIDDIEFKKEIPMPPVQKQTLFKFVTEKPPADVIWTALLDADIKPNSGYTDIQIRYMMYVILQCGDFKASKDLCNSFISGKPAGLATAFNAIIPNKAEAVKSIPTIKEGLPHWADESLYIPYYMSMSIVDLDSDLWVDLFKIRDQYTEEINFRQASISGETKDSFTLYNMLIYDFYPLVYFNKIFKYDPLMAPIEVSDKTDLNVYLKKRIIEYLNENDIFDYSEYILIPEFRLKNQGDTNEAQ